MKEWYPHPSGPIAMFIAAALQHPNPRCNGTVRRVSTIRVEQHKNKFNYVRVYCHLADKEMVEDSWKEAGFAGETSSEHFNKCFFNDAKLYRRTYRTMVWLMPQHKEITLRDADYGYLLFDNKDLLDAWLDETKTGETNESRLHNALSDIKIDDLRSFLHRVYDEALL